jgi:SAM-dependent methyltransferase
VSIKKALSFLRFLPIHPQWLLKGNKAAIRMLSNASGLVLDVGCADRWAESVLPSGCEYVGLDYPATGQDMYHCKPTVFADASQLPFPAETFNAVVMCEVLEHIARPREAILEAARVLRPDGLLILTMPFMYPMHDEPFDFQRYTSHGLRREMKEAGLQITQMESGLNSAESAGLNLSIALAGAAKGSIENRSAMIIFIPALVVLIALVNCISWTVGKLFPNWPALTDNFQVMAPKL